MEKAIINNGYEDVEVKVGDEVKLKMFIDEETDEPVDLPADVVSRQISLYEEHEDYTIEVVLEVKSSDEENDYCEVLGIYRHERSSDEEEF